MLYIDDLDILIYTTLSPKTSTIFVSTTRKEQSTGGDDEERLQTESAAGAPASLI